MTSVKDQSVGTIMDLAEKQTQRFLCNLVTKAAQRHDQLVIRVETSTVTEKVKSRDRLPYCKMVVRL